MSILKNAIKKIEIPTHDGSNQTVHLKIIDFKTEYNKESWGGYRYWLVHSPLPYSLNNHEDPNLNVSNDGINWITPEGINNPLDDAPGDLIDGTTIFHSDPDMVYNKFEDSIWIYYRLTDSKNKRQINKLIKVFCDGGVNIRTTEPIEIFNQEWDLTSKSIKDRSFAHWIESENKWHRWINYESKLYYSFSSDGINWGEIEPCLNNDGVDPFLAIGRPVWHLDVKPNYREKRIEILSYCNAVGEYLNYAECDMSNPKLVKTPIKDDIIIPSKKINTFDKDGLYKSTFVIEDIGDRYNYKIWYCGMNQESGQKVYSVGITEGSIGNSYRNLKLEAKKSIIKIGDRLNLLKRGYLGTPKITVLTGKDCIDLFEDYIVAKKQGVVCLQLIDGDEVSNKLFITIMKDMVPNANLKITIAKNEFITIPLLDRPIDECISFCLGDCTLYARLVENNNISVQRFKVKTEGGLKEILMYF